MSEERRGQVGSPTNQTGAPSCQQSRSRCTPWDPREASGGVPAQGRGAGVERQEGFIKAGPYAGCLSVCNAEMISVT